MTVAHDFAASPPRRSVFSPDKVSAPLDPAAEDVQLVNRMATGNQYALAQLFDRHSAVVLGVLARLLREHASAEEVLQETFLQAWQQAGRFDPDLASPRGWLLMIARSRALDRLRRRGSRQLREERILREQARDCQPVGTAGLEAEEKRRLVGAALATLSPPQRECIELAFFEGLTHTQIADRLGAPLGTVKSRILHGMTKLRDSLAACNRLY